VYFIGVWVLLCTFDSEGGKDFSTKVKLSVFINRSFLKNGKYKYDLSFVSLKFSVAGRKRPISKHKLRGITIMAREPIHSKLGGLSGCVRIKFMDGKI
jgi:hypothetical protein